MKNSELGLSVEVISQVAKLLQVALLTGTDIVDNLRQVKLCVDDNNDSVLVLSQEYKDNFETNLQRMLEKAKELEENE
jgi:hypothetical protein